MLSPGSPHYTYFLPLHLLRELKQPSLLFPMGRGLAVCLGLGCGPQDLLLIRLGQAVGSGCGLRPDTVELSPQDFSLVAN